MSTLFLPRNLTEDLFITTLLNKALVENDSQSQKLIMNYVDGLPKASLEVKGNLTISKLITKLKEDGESDE